MQWDFFFRTENKNFHTYWADKPAHQHRMKLPGTLTLQQAVACAHEDGIAKGSFRSGIFEVQNDLGVFTDVNRKTCSFKTWEQLEQDELNTH